MPHADAARLAAVIRRVGKDVAGERQQPRLLAQPALPFLEAVAEVFVDDRDTARSDGSYSHRRRHQHAVHAVAGGMADPDVLALVVFVVAPALLAALRAGADADHVDRAVRRIVVGVAEEILRGELPVRREHPFVHADHFGRRPADRRGSPAPDRDGRPRCRDSPGSPAPPGPTTPTPCPCTAPASAPRSATIRRGSACPHTARDTAARPAACRRWCSSRNDTGRRTARYCPARSGTPSCRDAGTNSGTRAPRPVRRGTGSPIPRPCGRR